MPQPQAPQAPSQPQPNQPSPDANSGGNSIELTPEEQLAQAELASLETGTPPAEDAPPAATPPAGEEGTPPAQEPPAPAAAAPTAQPGALPELGAVGDRDLEADLEAVRKEMRELQAEMRSGDIEDEEYDTRHEALSLRRDELIVARAEARTRAQLAEDFSNHSWKQNVLRFCSQPENVLLAGNEAMQKVWREEMQNAVNEAAAAGAPLADDLAIMQAGKDRLFKALGLSSPVTPPAPEPPGPPRATPPKLDNLPPSMGTVPAAVPSGHQQSIDELAAKPVLDIEAALFNMSEQQREALLRGTSGSFVD